MKIAIIGAGIFGCTIALKLSEKKKYQIEIFEEKNDILTGVSLKNQQRFHLGYHYPRSKNTIYEIKDSYKNFIKFYGKNIFGNTLNLYGISNLKSKLNFHQYLSKLKATNLPIKINKSFNIFSNSIENSIITNERILDYFKFKKLIKQKINIKKNINLKLNYKVKKIDQNQYDKIIIASYYNNNEILNSLGIKNLKKMKYELIEKIIVKLPEKLKKVSAVILDGNFLNFDPYIGTKYHLLSVVKEAKIEIIKNKTPKFKDKRKKLINLKNYKSSRVSNFRNFIKEGKKYIPLLSKAKYVNSFYTIRSINLDKNSHKRMSEIKTYGKKIITVHSGKWNTCVKVSEYIKKMIK